MGREGRVITAPGWEMGERVSEMERVRGAEGVKSSCWCSRSLAVRHWSGGDKGRASASSAGFGDGRKLGTEHWY